MLEVVKERVYVCAWVCGNIRRCVYESETGIRWMKEITEDIMVKRKRGRESKKVYGESFLDISTFLGDSLQNTVHVQLWTSVLIPFHETANRRNESSKNASCDVCLRE